MNDPKLKSMNNKFSDLETLSTEEKLKVLNALRARHELPPLTMGEALLGAGLTKEERNDLLSVCP